MYMLFTFQFFSTFFHEIISLVPIVRYLSFGSRDQITSCGLEHDKNLGELSDWEAEIESLSSVRWFCTLLLVTLNNWFLRR